jgi:hypothetical protein
VKKFLKQFLFSVALTLVALFLAGYSSEDEYVTTYQTHVVTEGQTLWGIATYYLPEQDRTRHLGEFVHRISQYNHIESYIQPGQFITIPLDKKKKRS